MTDARTLTTALGGRWWRGYGSAHCPVCQPERRKGQNALTLKDGRAGLLAHCKKSNCAFQDILAAAGVSRGDYRAPDPAILARREAEEQAGRARRARQARRSWEEAKPITATIAETYLREARGITCALPQMLRFHPECWHGATAKRYPALVALVEGGDAFAVHRTYLLSDGSGKAAIDPDKMMLGAVAGGAVRLAQGAGALVIGEGIESTLSAFILNGDPTANAWAALSTSGLRGLRLPGLGQFGGLGAPRASLIIAVDGEKAGRDAGRVLAERAVGLGWQVGIMDPGDGADFNDLLLKGARHEHV